MAALRVRRKGGIAQFQVKTIFIQTLIVFTILLTINSATVQTKRIVLTLPPKLQWDIVNRKTFVKLLRKAEILRSIAPKKSELFPQKFDFLARLLFCKSLTKLIENDYQYHWCRLFHLTIYKTKIPLIKFFAKV